MDIWRSSSKQGENKRILLRVRFRIYFFLILELVPAEKEEQSREPSNCGETQKTERVEQLIEASNWESRATERGKQRRELSNWEPSNWESWATERVEQLRELSNWESRTTERAGQLREESNCLLPHPLHNTHQMTSSTNQSKITSSTSSPPESRATERVEQLKELSN